MTAHIFCYFSAWHHLSKIAVNLLDGPQPRLIDSKPSDPGIFRSPRIMCLIASMEPTQVILPRKDSSKAELTRIVLLPHARSKSWPDWRLSVPVYCHQALWVKLFIWSTFATKSYIMGYCTLKFDPKMRKAKPSSMKVFGMTKHPQPMWPMAISGLISPSREIS